MKSTIFLSVLILHSFSSSFAKCLKGYQPSDTTVENQTSSTLPTNQSNSTVPNIISNVTNPTSGQSDTKSQILNLRTKIMQKKFKSISYINGFRQDTQQNYESDIGLGSPYDIMIFTFWNPAYLAGSIITLNNPSGEIGWLYPTVDPSKILDEIKKKFIKEEKLLFISAFGDSFAIGNQDPEQVALQLAKWVNERPQIDGIDLDLEDNGAFQQNTFLPWLSKFQRKLVDSLNDKNILISHAPQAFYFSREHYKNWNALPYQDLPSDVKNQISLYNIQFYNQGGLCPYESYENLFIKSSSNCPATSVLEIAKSIPLEKIIVGKPANQADVVNTGFISTSSFSSYFYKFKLEQNQQAAGYFFWSLNRGKGLQQGKEMAQVTADMSK